MGNKRVILGLMLAAGASMFAWSSSALATPVTQTINLDQVFTGTTPGGTAPWLTATFAYDNSGSSNTGTLTLTSNLAGGGFLQGGTGKITGWNFFISDSNSLSGTPVCGSGTCADTVRTTTKSKIGPIEGGFNLGFGWDSGDRFNGGDTATYTLTFANDLTSSPFVGNADGWFAVAHVQGLTVAQCDGSGWIVAGTFNGTGAAPGSKICGGPPPTNVPEPGALGIFGLGVLLIGGFLGLRRRYS